MIFCKSKFVWLLIALCCALPAQAKWFGLFSNDREEFVHARETYNNGQYEQAIQELSNYIYKTENIKRREARAYRLLGLSYEQLNQPDKALEIYLEALEFHQKNIPLLLAAASLYERTGLIDQSIKLYNRVLELDSNNQEALSGLADDYLQMGFYSRSVSYYTQYLQQNPQAEALHRARLAYAFFKQRDFKNAFIQITLAKEQEPQESDYWLLSARAYKGMQMTQQALDDLDIAIWLNPDQVELRIIKSMWLYQLDKKEDSLKEARNILRDNPNNELALFMVYLNLKDTKPKQARQALQQIQDLGNDSFAYRVANKILTQ